MVQLTEELIEQLDERAARDGVSRSQLIRDAVAAHLAQDARAHAVRRFSAAYADRPDDPAEMSSAERSAREMVAEEPW
jgi:metal-responsive CopG/Arc/MetJ family transcriptional regulator